MTIFKLPQQSIRWLLAEICVVVMGILLAISIDAWWQGLEDRRVEHALLQALATEFETNQEFLDLQFTAYDRRASGAQALLDLGPDLTGVETDLLVSH